jgi:uncharacterized protein YbjT (DUF2867 family)
VEADAKVDTKTDTTTDAHDAAEDGTRGRRVVVLGATGAVGSRAVRTMEAMPDVAGMTLLGRRALEGVTSSRVDQHSVDVFDPRSYGGHLRGHDAAICTFWAGQPSKMRKDEFVRIDKEAVLAFARACRREGVRHFELLGSVGADPGSPSFYLRTKGELEEGIRALGFERLSLFRPSMILTPTNRYGFSQALTLAVWPRLRPLLVGSLRKYRGIEVDRLGRAIALNLRGNTVGAEVLHWDDIEALAERAVAA